MTLYAKLAAIQKELNAPKNQRNNFGGYNYRSCEDILMAVKPILGDLSIIISDEMVMLGDRFYVKATAAITDGKERIESTAYAREAAAKKGMDESQITGSTSSYARKYALNGLLLIDDNKDADAHDNREEGGAANNPDAKKLAEDIAEAKRQLDACAGADALKATFASWWEYFKTNETGRAEVKKYYDAKKPKLKEAA